VSPQEASEECLSLTRLFRDITEYQMESLHKRFQMDTYQKEDVVQAATELRPVVNFFDYERFNAIWNHIRQQNTDPKKKLESAVDELRRDQRRLEEKSILERKAAIQKRIRELGHEERMRLAQAAIDRMPEEMRLLYESVGFFKKKDIFEIASIREEAAAIMEAK
jgi:hypothetical protein